eukprot:m.40334 g.40334  ORF g.40334 m.40334 type:complete len:208 (+) comp5994_c0_seq3:534-1157(+)
MRVQACPPKHPHHLLLRRKRGGSGALGHCTLSGRRAAHRQLACHRGEKGHHCAPPQRDAGTHGSVCWEQGQAGQERAQGVVGQCADRLTQDTGSELGDAEKLPAGMLVQGSTCHGYLERLRMAGGWDRVYYILKGNMLAYYSGPAAKSALGVLCVADYSVEKSPGEKPRMFTLGHSSDRSLTLNAETDPELEMWVNALRSAAAVGAK